MSVARRDLGRWRRALSGALALLALHAGCGYSTGTLIPDRHSKVHVPVFGNRTYYRDLEIELTRQVHRELGSRPGIFIVGREEADIVLVGVITQFRQSVLSEDNRDRTRESSALTRVQIEVQDARNPSHVWKTFEVTDRAEFFLARGESLATATTESFFDLARKIVNGLEEDFPRAVDPRQADAPEGTN